VRSASLGVVDQRGIYLSVVLYKQLYPDSGLPYAVLGLPMLRLEPCAYAEGYALAPELRHKA